MKNKRPVFAALFLLETALLFYFSLVPFQPAVAGPGGRAGDAEHLGAYFLYGFLAAKLLEGRIQKKTTLLFAAFAVAFLVGGVNELIQAFIPYRTADGLDMLVNGVGAAIGLAASRVEWY